VFPVFHLPGYLAEGVMVGSLLNNGPGLSPTHCRVLVPCSVDPIFYLNLACQSQPRPSTVRRRPWSEEQSPIVEERKRVGIRTPARTDGDRNRQGAATRVLGSREVTRSIGICHQSSEGLINKD
jgi:hypothetical protein